MRSLMASRKKQNRENIAVSGIAEEVSDFQRHLDEMVCEKEEYEVQQVEERERANAREQKLLKAGKIVQRMALERKRVGEATSTELNLKELRLSIRRKTSELSGLDDETQWNIDVKKHLNDQHSLE